ncbi:MAG: UrcA family protein [Steroidobacteraceae bacterium]
MIAQMIRAAGLVAVCLAAPIAALAQQPSAATPTGTAKVLLAGLDLTTAEGIAAARNRLHETARQICSQRVGNLEPADRAGFLSCIDNTLINELKQVNSSARAAIVAHGSAWPTAPDDEPISQLRESAPPTSVIVVSIADLDVLSPQDVLIARKRVHDIARRICSQLISSQDPATRYAKCVNDATAGALRQIN